MSDERASVVEQGLVVSAGPKSRPPVREIKLLSSRATISQESLQVPGTYPDGYLPTTPGSRVTSPGRWLRSHPHLSEQAKSPLGSQYARLTPGGPIGLNEDAAEDVGRNIPR